MQSVLWQQGLLGSVWDWEGGSGKGGVWDDPPRCFPRCPSLDPSPPPHSFRQGFADYYTLAVVSPDRREALFGGGGIFVSLPELPPSPAKHEQTPRPATRADSESTRRRRRLGRQEEEEEEEGGASLSEMYDVTRRLRQACVQKSKVGAGTGTVLHP